MRPLRNAARAYETNIESIIARISDVTVRDELTYTRHPSYYGHIYPVEQQARETRVIVRIHARRITLDAIHA